MRIRKEILGFKPDATVTDLDIIIALNQAILKSKHLDPLLPSPEFLLSIEAQGYRSELPQKFRDLIKLGSYFEERSAQKRSQSNDEEDKLDLNSALSILENCYINLLTTDEARSYAKQIIKKLKETPESYSRWSDCTNVLKDFHRGIFYGKFDNDSGQEIEEIVSIHAQETADIIRGRIYKYHLAKN